MAALRAPSSSSRARMRNTSRYSPGRTSSNTLQSPAAASSRLPAASACSIPAASGRRFGHTSSARAKRLGVGMPKSGLQSTIRQSGSAGSAVSRSPLPSANAVPPAMQKGTSLPTVSPTA